MNYEKNDVPLVKFGILADIQYANVEDLEKYGRFRYYRNSLNLLRSAIKDWQQLKSTSDEINFILDLGDLVDSIQSGTYLEDMNLILNEIDLLFDNKKVDRADRPLVLHCWGNHEGNKCLI